MTCISIRGNGNLNLMRMVLQGFFLQNFFSGNCFYTQTFFHKIILTIQINISIYGCLIYAKGQLSIKFAVNLVSIFNESFTENYEGKRTYSDVIIQLIYMIF